MAGEDDEEVEQMQTVGQQEVQEMVTLHFQLMMNAASKAPEPEEEAAADGALAAPPTQSNVLSLFGGPKQSRAELKAEVDKVKEWMDNDPRRRELKVMSKAEKQSIFRDDVDQMRRKLEKAGHEYGNVIYQRVDKARRSGLLTLRGLGVRALPPEVQQLSNISIADVSHNRLDRLNEFVMTLPNLVVLNASFNYIDHVVGEMSATGLRILNLAFNSLDSDDIQSMEGLTKLESLQLLYLSNNRISTLPKSFSNMTLLDLYIGENKFKEIPPVICNMTTLQKLSIACNTLATIPSAISRLKNLKFIDISFNHIVDFPSEIQGLKFLEHLNVGFNPLGPVLPDAICNCTSLIELNMDFCDVVSLPKEIGNLQQLEVLQLDGNPLEYPYDVLYAKDPLLLVSFNSKHPVA